MQLRCFAPVSAALVDCRMKEKSSATYISGLSTGIAGGLFLAINEIYFYKSGISFLLAGLIGFFLYGVIGLAFTSLLIILFKPIFKKCSLPVSCIIFVATGILVPLFILHWDNQIPAHGIDPYSPQEILGTLATMFIICFIGAIGAFSAWFTLRKESQSNGN